MYNNRNNCLDRRANVIARYGADKFNNRQIYPNSAKEINNDVGIATSIDSVPKGFYFLRSSLLNFHEGLKLVKKLCCKNDAEIDKDFDDIDEEQYNLFDEIKLTKTINSIIYTNKFYVVDNIRRNCINTDYLKDKDNYISNCKVIAENQNFNIRPNLIPVEEKITDENINIFDISENNNIIQSELSTRFSGNPYKMEELKQGIIDLYDYGIQVFRSQISNLMFTNAKSFSTMIDKTPTFCPNTGFYNIKYFLISSLKSLKENTINYNNENDFDDSDDSENSESDRNDHFDINDKFYDSEISFDRIDDSIVNILRIFNNIRDCNNPRFINNVKLILCCTYFKLVITIIDGILSYDGTNAQIFHPCDNYDATKINTFYNMFIYCYEFIYAKYCPDNIYRTNAIDIIKFTKNPSRYLEEVLMKKLKNIYFTNNKNTIEQREKLYDNLNEIIGTSTNFYKAYNKIDDKNTVIRNINSTIVIMNNIYCLKKQDFSLNSIEINNLNFISNLSSLIISPGNKKDNKRNNFLYIILCICKENFPEFIRKIIIDSFGVNILYSPENSLEILKNNKLFDTIFTLLYGAAHNIYDVFVDVHDFIISLKSKEFSILSVNYKDKGDNKYSETEFYKSFDKLTNFNTISSNDKYLYGNIEKNCDYLLNPQIFIKYTFVNLILLIFNKYIFASKEGISVIRTYIIKLLTIQKAVNNERIVSSEQQEINEMLRKEHEEKLIKFKTLINNLSDRPNFINPIGTKTDKIETDYEFINKLIISQEKNMMKLYTDSRKAYNLCLFKPISIPRKFSERDISKYTDKIKDIIINVNSNKYTCSNDLKYLFINGCKFTDKWLDLLIKVSESLKSISMEENKYINNDIVYNCKFLSSNSFDINKSLFEMFVIYNKYKENNSYSNFVRVFEDNVLTMNIWNKLLTEKIIPYITNMVYIYYMIVFTCYLSIKKDSNTEEFVNNKIIPYISKLYKIDNSRDLFTLFDRDFNKFTESSDKIDNLLNNEKFNHRLLIDTFISNDNISVDNIINLSKDISASTLIMDIINTFEYTRIYNYTGYDILSQVEESELLFIENYNKSSIDDIKRKLNLLKSYYRTTKNGSVIKFCLSTSILVDKFSHEYSNYLYRAPLYNILRSSFSSINEEVFKNKFTNFNCKSILLDNLSSYIPAAKKSFIDDDMLVYSIYQWFVLIKTNIITSDELNVINQNNNCKNILIRRDNNNCIIKFIYENIINIIGKDNYNNIQELMKNYKCKYEYINNSIDLIEINTVLNITAYDPFYNDNLTDIFNLKYAKNILKLDSEELVNGIFKMKSYIKNNLNNVIN